MSPVCPHHQLHPRPAMWALLSRSLTHGHPPTPPPPAHHGGAAGMQANACPAREPHISGASWWPVVARGGPWLWDTPELPRVSTRGSQNATNRGGGTVAAARHCSVGAPGHATALGGQTGTVTPSCGLQSQPARKPLSSRHRLQGENLHVCPCVGWPGEFAAPRPGGPYPTASALLQPSCLCSEFETGHVWKQQLQQQRGCSPHLGAALHCLSDKWVSPSSNHHPAPHPNPEQG